MKLLLFLPLILGLASFKKLLGFFAIIIPGLIGFFKLCRPNLSSPFAQPHPHTPSYTPAGVGYRPSYYKENDGYANDYSENYYDDSNRQFTFKDSNHAQNLAYNGYSHYRNNEGNIESELGREQSTKKSILPDS